MPRRPDVPCTDCGELMWRGTGSLPDGQATCRPCRAARYAGQDPKQLQRERVKRANQSPCVDCALPAYGQRCRACEDVRRRVSGTGRDNEKRRLLERRRIARDRQAPGLTSWQRKRLLTKWQGQGRGCAYCPGPAESVDHVVPLALGGTNYEGNLVPACKSCNTTKNDSLLIEWRHKKRAQHQRTHVEVTLPKPRIPKRRRWAEQAPAFKLCSICDALHHRQGLTCSDACAIESNRVRIRNTYRLRVGIPLDAPDQRAIANQRRAA